MVMFDIPWDYQLSLQEPATPIMEELINFHNYIMIYITFIIFLVSWILVSIIINFTYEKRVISHRYLIHGTVIEIIWTITPALVLVGIAFPSFKLLYLMDEVIAPAITIKVIGHQWYRSYEYSDYATLDGKSISFDSYMVPTADLNPGDFRLLEVDNRVIVPVDTHVRVIITAADVLHSWAVPSLGVKLDAVPGRLNQTSFLINRLGVFYGQCSEICGVNHAFMPICVEAVSLEDYCTWVDAKLSDAS
jgi:cytochrome c oxidase subunit 2